MQLIDKSRTNFSIPQRFFIEKVLEMLQRATIDTYRARVMNPKTILEEVCELIKGRIKGRIPNKQAMLYAVNEAKQLIGEKESYLTFNPFSKDRILSTLGKLHEDNNTDQLKKNFIVLRDFYFNHNKNYCSRLIQFIEESISQYDDAQSIEENFNVLESISNLSTYFVTELMSLGYTKRYLYRKVHNEFNSKNTRSFVHAFENLKKIIEYELATYSVIFKLEIPTAVVDSLSLNPEVKMVEEIDYFLDGDNRTLPEEVTSFITKRHRTTYFYCLEVKARDVFQALNKGRINFAENLDLIHIGYSEQFIKPFDKALVVNDQHDKKKYFTVHPLAYELDGQFKDGKDLYKSLIDGITIIEQNSEIKRDTKEKIKSSVRYLRLGNEALEVEHKFINYWFALEHLFSDALTDNQENTINKIKRTFPKLHSNIFTKRLLKDFHDNIIRLGIKSQVPGFDSTNTNYLREKATYDWIATNLSQRFPLLAFRSLKLVAILFGGGNEIATRLKRHKSDLELHLARMYRIRNSIVHDAAVGKNIISITANLKYYLIFVISYIIKALENNSSLQSIEDLFALAEETYDSLEKENFPLDKILTIDTHFDIIE